MNELQIFNNPSFGSVRTIEINGKVWFGATDVATALGYVNPRKAVLDHCKSDGVTIREVIDSMGRPQQMKFINNGNVIRLTANSRLPKAEEFESWIFDDLVPSVIKDGGYMLSKDNESPEELMARALKVADITIKKKDERIAQLQTQNERLLPKADFADKVFNTNGKVDIGQAAKILNLGYGRNTLFAKLRESGIFFANRNEPKQRYIDAGYFEMKEEFITRNSHPGFTVMKVLVTQKGLALINKTLGGNPCDGKTIRIA